MQAGRLRYDYPRVRDCIGADAGACYSASRL
jgi:hypothetical protein